MVYGALATNIARKPDYNATAETVKYIMMNVEINKIQVLVATVPNIANVVDIKTCLIIQIIVAN